MRAADYLQLTTYAVIALRFRSFLTALGIGVGIAAVVLMTSLGEGIHRYVLAEFSQFGTNLIAVAPGKTTTHGVSGAVISNVRPLTLEDADALTRLPQVRAVVPVFQGNAAVEAGKLTRRSAVFGVGPDVPLVWRINTAQGRFLPADSARAARAFAVLGSKLKTELFGAGNPLGQRIRIGGERYRVIGTMESKGQLLGFDLDDAVYIPAAKALEMFDKESLMEIDLLYASDADADQVAKGIKKMLIARHGEEDFTITTQEQMLTTLGNILNILTLSVAALGGISLLVGGVGILTIMLITVSERTAEIGLLRAIGASRGQILILFVGEAIILASLGGLLGLAAGTGLAGLANALIPGLPIHISWTHVVQAEVLAALIGLAAGIKPAIQAAGLNPVDALRAE